MSPHQSRVFFPLKMLTASELMVDICLCSAQDGVDYVTAVATLAWKQHVTVEYRITSLWPDTAHYTKAISEHWNHSATRWSGTVPFSVYC
jgi:hypothetical protein